MYFKQFYLGCLAHASYLVGSAGEAAVVDPQRDVDQYLAEAAAAGLKIKYVVETHLHADFVSGHRELAARTGAEIVIGARAGATFPHRAVKDGDELRVGQVIIRVLETPGHTPESISFLLIDTEAPDAPQKVLTGDTLFVGDVGRPDLAGARGFTPQQMAGMMYESLHGKLLKLDDGVEVWPAHGAGSMCGRNISKETSSTIGQQRRFNYALAPMARDEFVRLLTTDLPEAPAYFARDVAINRDGAPDLAELPDPAALEPGDVAALQKKGAVVLDTRPAAQFGAGHVPGSLNIGLSGQFASWAGALIAPTVPIVLVAEEADQVREARTRLARVGLENVAGYLAGGILEWHGAGLPLATTEQISVEELDARLREGSAGRVLDVRRPGEWQAGHIAEAVHAPLNTLSESAAAMPKDQPVAAICAGGYRSSIATSVLERQGFTKVTNVVGGMAAWKNANLETAAA
jgi:glyoxylase-like metal-dependent hydrolase (beta-lactamase superfamily II)/rhodanese-related sulfurtransferase